MPEEFSIEKLVPTTRLSPSPVTKIWRYKKERKKRAIEKYKKRRKKTRNGHIDIYV